MDTEVFKVTDRIWGIDAEMLDTRVSSVYVLVDEELTLIDAATANSVETICTGLTEIGVSVTDLKRVLLSHIHVDHSGGAAGLAAQNSDLSVYIHEATADHLVNPKYLIESSKRALPDTFEEMGEQGSVSAENLIPIPADGTVVETGDRRLDVRPLPGHSPDHIVVWDASTGVLFANEALGYYFPKTDTWLPPATIPNFDIESVAAAIDEAEALDPERITLLHFGEYPGPPDEAFDRARDRLTFFNDRIPELYEQYQDSEKTKHAVETELLDLTPAYTELVESMYAHLLTQGYLIYHGYV